jgi:hypothetical protein
LVVLRYGLGVERTRTVPHAMEFPDRVPKEQYFDPDFYDLECERLWPRVWQMACRLEQIPNSGDAVEYEILDQSVIVVRTERLLPALGELNVNPLDRGSSISTSDRLTPSGQPS